MREYAVLRRNIELLADFFEHGEQRMRAFDAIGSGIDADHRVPGAQ